jgi:hypothetical protein
MGDATGSGGGGFPVTRLSAIAGVMAADPAERARHILALAIDALRRSLGERGKERQLEVFERHHLGDGRRPMPRPRPPSGSPCAEGSPSTRKPWVGSP